MLINAYVIYDGTNNIYVGNQGVQISINCERLQAFSPRPVWLLRYLAPGDGTTPQYEPVFSPTSAQLLDANTLAGFWIEQDQKDVMIDATTIAAFQQACDACCGSVPTIVANLYGGAAPVFTPLTLNSFCLFRLDNGDVPAFSQASLDYMDQSLGGSFKMTSHITGVSHFTFQSFYTTITPVGPGGDVITSGPCSS